jgi:ferredoxin
MSTRINVAANSPETFDRKGVETHMDRCVHTRHRLASCARCVQACPVGAVSLTKAISVDTAKCTGCGVCTTVCPSGAFEAASPGALELCSLAEAQARRSKKVTFRCENHPDGVDKKPEDAINVPCIGRIDESILLAAVAAGAKTVRLLDGGCQRCERKRGSDVAICAAQQVNFLLESLGVLSRLQIVSQPSSGATLRKVQAARPGVMSRRDFFAMLWGARTGERITSARVSEESQRNRAPLRASIVEDVKYIPAKWRILSTSIRNLGAAPRRSMFSGDLWANVAINGNCNGCLMCASSCPTGALAKIEQDGKVGLSFTAAHCTACNLCTEVCFRNCLSVTSSADNMRIINGEARLLAFHERKAVELLTASMEDRLLRLLGVNGIH